MVARDGVQAAWPLLSGLWSESFADVPWTSQPLSVDLLPSLPAHSVRTLFGGLEWMPQAHWEMPDGSCLEATGEVGPDGWVAWRCAVDSGTPVSPARFVMVQPQGTQEVASCVVMQEDPACGEWQVVYNSLDRCRALVEQLRRSMEGAGLRTHSGLLPLVEALIMGRTPKAAALIDGDGELRASKSVLVALLERFQLEWNSHGLKRTFRHWPASRKQSYLREALEIMNQLRSVSGGVCLGFGAVLGWQRAKDLVPHDDDLDILVAFDRREVPDLGQALERVEAALLERGCVIKGRFFAHLWVQLDHDSPQTLDVFVGLMEDDAVSFYPSQRAGLKVDMVFPAVEQELLGVALPMPARIEDYLAATYGPRWTSPDPAFSHPWSRESYADIAGRRVRPPMWTRGELQHRRP